MAFHSEALKNALANLDLDGMGDGGETGFAIALSGGADSMALLVALSECFSVHRILALHFDHGIHPESKKWLKHCQKVCEKKQIPFLSGSWTEIDVPVRKREASAREARYQWFTQVLPENYVMLTGHHLDDQAETVLMNLAEGRSLDRVAGIRPVRQLCFGDCRQVVRPLLGFRHRELQEYLQKKQVEWVEDPANRDASHSRSLLRQKVMPVLTGRWPKAAESIDRLANELADTLAIVESMAEEVIASCQQPRLRTLFCKTVPIKLAPLMALPDLRFNTVIRTWIHRGRVSSPGRKQLVEFYRQLSSVSSASHCQLSAGGFEIIYFDGHLYLIERDEFIVEGRQQFVPQDDRFCPGLEVNYINNPEGIDSVWFDSGKLVWRMRNSGDRFVVSQRSGSSDLKKVMQGRKLAPWLRRSLPVLAYEYDVVWAHGVGVNARYQSPDREAGGKLPTFSLGTATGK